MRFWRTAGGAWLVFGAAFFLFAASVGAQDLERVRKTATSIHEQGKFPTELHRKKLTQEQMELPGGVSDFLENVFTGLGDAARATAPFANWAFIVLAVVLVILFALALYRLRPRIELNKEKKTAKRSKKSRPKASAKATDPSLTEEGLAKLLEQGLYSQAVTYLLRLIFCELGYDRDIEEQSLTPREVVALAQSPELMEAVRIAEQVRFAGQSASQQQIDELQSIRKHLQIQSREGERRDNAALGNNAALGDHAAF